MTDLEKTQIQIGYIPLLDCVAILWAKQRGFFDEVGLPKEWQHNRAKECSRFGFEFFLNLSWLNPLIGSVTVVEHLINDVPFHPLSCDDSWHFFAAVEMLDLQLRYAIA